MRRYVRLTQQKMLCMLTPISTCAIRMQSQVEDAKNDAGEAHSAKEHAEVKIKELKDKMEQMRRTYQDVENGAGSKTHQLQAVTFPHIRTITGSVA